MKAQKVLASLVLLGALATPATAQIQPGPNLTASGRPFLYAPRAGYLGPPIAVHRWPPFPFIYSRTGAPSISVLDGPYAPPMAYAPAPPVAPLPSEALCIVDPSDIGFAPFLNVRTSPNGWIVGQLPNGTPVFPTGEAAGNWVVIAAPIPGWVFRPYLACRPPPPVDAYAYQPPPPAYEPPAPPPARPKAMARPRGVPCPDGCPRDPDDVH